MFLDCEQSGVQGYAQELELRHPSSPGAAKRKGEQLGDNLRGVDISSVSLGDRRVISRERYIRRRP